MEEVDALHVIEKLAAAAFIDVYFADTKLAIQGFVVLHGVHVKIKMSGREAPSLICNHANVSDYFKYRLSRSTHHQPKDSHCASSW